VLLTLVLAATTLGGNVSARTAAVHAVQAGLPSPHCCYYHGRVDFSVKFFGTPPAFMPLDRLWGHGEGAVDSPYLPSNTFGFGPNSGAIADAGCTQDVLKHPFARFPSCFSRTAPRGPVPPQVTLWVLNGALQVIPLAPCPRAASCTRRFDRYPPFARVLTLHVRVASLGNPTCHNAQTATVVLIDSDALTTALNKADSYAVRGWSGPGCFGHTFTISEAAPGAVNAHGGHWLKTGGMFYVLVWIGCHYQGGVAPQNCSRVPWPGTYSDGAHVYTIHASGSSLTGHMKWTAPLSDPPGGDFAKHGSTENFGSCTANGHSATCPYVTGEYHDPDKRITYTAQVTLTLSEDGKTLTTSRTLTSTKESWTPGVAPYASVVHVGATFTDTDKRIGSQ
jgi:hypothetical protein